MRNANNKPQAIIISVRIRIIRLITVVYGRYLSETAHVWNVDTIECWRKVTLLFQRWQANIIIIIISI